MSERTIWGTFGRILARIVAPIMLAAVVAACNGDGGSGEQSDDVLRRANGAEPDSLDIHHASGTWENNIIGDLFMGLYTDDPEANAIKGLAETHEISEDGLVHTFTIRRDAKWSDGVPVTAHDFVFAYRRILNPMTAARYASILYPFKNAQAINEGRMDVDELQVFALDDHTLEIHLEHPAPYMPQLLTHYTTFPVPAHAVRAHGDRWTRAGNMVSNGAYHLKEWRTNEHVHLVKNEHFWDADNVAIREVYFLPITDASTAERRFRAGEVDMTSDFPSQRYGWLKENLPAETRVHTYVATTYIVFNTEREPFTGERGRMLREALALSIDRAVIAHQILGTGQVPAYAMVPPGMANYHNAAQMYFKDMSMEERRARARAIMTELGYGPDNPFRFEYRYRDGVDNRRVAVAIASMWKEVFVDASLINTEVKTHYNDLQQGNFVSGDAGWVADFDDPINYLFLLETRSGLMNYGNYSNPEYDALLTLANHTIDVEERADILARAEQMMLDDAPIIPTIFGATRALVHQYVEGYVDNKLNIHRTRFMRINRERAAAFEAAGN